VGSASFEVYEGDGLYYTEYGFGYDLSEEDNAWKRQYIWDDAMRDSAYDNTIPLGKRPEGTYEDNRLKWSIEGDLTVEYRYGADDGMRPSEYYNTIPLGKRPRGTYSMWPVSAHGVTVGDNLPELVGENFPVSCP